MTQKNRNQNSADTRLVLKGIEVSPGIAAGRLFHYRDILSREVERYHLGGEEVNEEIIRVLEAIEKVKSDIQEMQKRVDRDFSAEQAGIECSLCGELAGDMEYTEKLTALGLRYFSVSPYRIPKLREKLLEISKNLSSRR